MTIGGIGIGSALAIYFIMWWLCLFVVLPWGVRSQHENDAVTPGSDPGAPVVPHIGRKLIATTFVAAVLFVGFVAAKQAGFNFDFMPGPKPHHSAS
jgi:predicted secreted protein